MNWRAPAYVALAVYVAAGVVPSLVAAPAVDLVIVPGKRIGLVRADASLDDFTKAFGSINIKEGDVYLGEESEDPGLTLFPKDPDRRLRLGWKDPERKRGVRQIFIAVEPLPARPQLGKWRLQNGIAIGTTLKDMERLNGRPFTLYFTDYDAGCGISSWRGGKLAGGFGQTWKVLVDTDTSWSSRISAMRKARNSDVITFESNSAEMRSANPWVRSIYVYF